MANIESIGNFFSVPESGHWKIKSLEDNEAKKQDVSFGDQLMSFMKEVNHSQNSSNNLQQDYLTGKKVEPHELMMGMEKASMMLNLSVRVRDEMVKAWNDLIRTA